MTKSPCHEGSISGILAAKHGHVVMIRALELVLTSGDRPFATAVDKMASESVRGRRMTEVFVATQLVCFTFGMAIAHKCNRTIGPRLAVAIGLAALLHRVVFSSTVFREVVGGALKESGARVEQGLAERRRRRGYLYLGGLFDGVDSLVAHGANHLLVTLTAAAAFIPNLGVVRPLLNGLFLTTLYQLWQRKPLSSSVS